MILESDKETRKLSLGHKQTEDNPWDTFENVFPIGSTHEATVLRKDDRGAIVQLPHGLEAFAPIKHIKKEDGTTAEAGETLNFKVIEFNRDDKRILVSHSRIVEDAKKVADDADRKARAGEEGEMRKAVEETQQKVEKDTLGDLAALVQLKDQLNDSN